MRTRIASVIVRGILAGWLCLIVLSTLLVYQHHFIDIPTGVLVGLIVIYLVPARRQGFFTSRFTTPRHIKIGMYYLFGSLLMLLIAFSTAYLSGFFLWIFFTLLMVSIIYAFGLNDLLAGKHGQANWIQWLIFAPYFLGSYLSWHYYRRKIPLMSHVKAHVYLGRYPTEKEFDQVESSGITQAFNLATEQQLQKTRIPQSRRAFLDLTIQSPESLYQLARDIDALEGQNVYVHCALGLSRSVLAVAAWLLYKGHSLEDVENLIGEHRIDYLKSPYMQVALDLFQSHLTTIEASANT